MNPELLDHHDFLDWLRVELLRRNNDQNNMFQVEYEREYDKELMALSLVSDAFKL